MRLLISWGDRTKHPAIDGMGAEVTITIAEFHTSFSA